MARPSVAPIRRDRSRPVSVASLCCAACCETGVVRVALYAGSFDPIHLGHLGVISRASAIYDRVVVAVLANPEKASGMFRPEARLQFIDEATSHLGNVTSQHFYGLTVDLATRVGATVLIRAAHKEWDKEFSMAAMNLRLSGIPTVMIPAETETSAISSSLVRNLSASGDVATAAGLVPPCVGAALAGEESSSLA